MILSPLLQFKSITVLKHCEPAILLFDAENTDVPAMDVEPLKAHCEALAKYVLATLDILIELAFVVLKSGEVYALQATPTMHSKAEYPCERVIKSVSLETFDKFLLSTRIS